MNRIVFVGLNGAPGTEFENRVRAALQKTSFSGARITWTAANKAITVETNETFADQRIYDELVAIISGALALELGAELNQTNETVLAGPALFTWKEEWLSWETKLLFEGSPIAIGLIVETSDEDISSQLEFARDFIEHPHKYLDEWYDIIYEWIKDELPGWGEDDPAYLERFKTDLRLTRLNIQSDKSFIAYYLLRTFDRRTIQLRYSPEPHIVNVIVD